MYWDKRCQQIEKEVVIIEKGTQRAKTKIKLYGTRVVDGGIALGGGEEDIPPEKLRSIIKGKGNYVKHEIATKDHIKVDGESKYDINTLKDYLTILKDDKRVKQARVIFSYSSVIKRFSNSFGANITLEFPAVSLYLESTVKNCGKIETYTERIATIGGWEKVKKAHNLAHSARRKAIKLTRAKKPPAGRMEVVLDNEMTGVFFHEAVGHALEADEIIKGDVLSDKTGKKIASDVITLYSDGRLKTNGYTPYDDEGVKAKRTTLIENGFLKGHMHSLITASKMGAEPTGNGRAEDPTHFQIPRMTNLVLKKGDSNLNEMIKETKRGVYITGFRGGVVDTTKGQFSFTGGIGYYIERGEIKHAVKMVSFEGNILSTMKRISLVGKHYGGSGGFCGKAGQYVRVDERVPKIKIDEVVVGGSN